MPRRASYLTARQKEILEFIREHTRDTGLAPTHREICTRFGYSSYGTVYKHLKLLQEKGFLRREWNQKRGIEVVDRPLPGQRPPGEVELPFFGRIAAGRPVEAVAGDETLGVPGHLLGGRNGDHYVLEVVGESMIDEGIHEGDLVVVQRREVARAGEMVVALVGNEATLKRFFPEGARIRLQPANPNMEPLFVAAADVQVQGIVVGLMRKF
jgi:repressor LexA